MDQQCLRSLRPARRTELVLPVVGEQDVQQLSTGFGRKLLQLTDFLVDKERFHRDMADQSTVVCVLDRSANLQFPDLAEIVQEAPRNHQVMIEPVVSCQRSRHGGHRHRVLQETGAERVMHGAGGRGRPEELFDLGIGEYPEEQLADIGIAHLFDERIELIPKNFWIDGRRADKQRILD